MKSVYTGEEKVAEFESYDELRVGDGNPAFIYEGSELVYPNPVKDGLILWYDFSGRTNADGQRGVAEDLSGNGNHGTLQNFNYTAESGYDKNKLLFDGVDDFLQVPETGLNPESMAVVENGKIYSYEGDKTTSVNIDGDIFESGRNLFISQNNKFPTITIDGEEYWEVRGNSTGRDTTITIQIDDTEPNQYTVQFLGQVGQYFNRAMFVDNEGQRFSQDFPDGANYLFTSPKGIIVKYFTIDTGGVVYRGYIKKDTFKLEKGAVATPYTSAPEDYLSTIHTPSQMQDLLLYNRPLTPEEIQHNYAIEKDRFNIE